MKGLNWVHIDQKCNLRSFILASRWQSPIHPLVMGLNQPISQVTASQVTEFVVDQVLRTNSQIWASLSLGLMGVGRDLRVTCLLYQKVSWSSGLMGRCPHGP